MARSPEDALHFPLGETLPLPGRTLEVAPGVRWARMALPFALDHINVWMLRDRLDGRDGWTLVDCGIANDDTRTRWDAVLTHELQGLPVLRVVATHMHPDHVGLAQWLTERASVPGHPCRLWMSAADYQTARMATLITSGVGGEAAARFFRRHGLVDEASLAKVRERRDHFRELVPAMPESYHRLMHGQVLHIGGEDWRCIVGYGHSPEHMSLVNERRGVLLSGDMVLPRISTNVSVSSVEPDGNPLELYLDSIAALRTLPAYTLVLPSHGRPFVGLHERIAQLQRHHDARLADALEACRQSPRSAADLLPVLFSRRLDLHQTTFAMGEAIAHLHALVVRGQLASELDADEVLRFCTVR